MADARSAWNQTGDKLSELGRTLRSHYDTQHGADGPAARQDLADAARKAGSALTDAFEALGTAARDSAVHSDVKQVGLALLDALGATIGQASEEVRRAFSDRGDEQPTTPAPAPEGVTPADPPATATPADDADHTPRVEP